MEIHTTLKKSNKLRKGGGYWHVVYQGNKIKIRKRHLKVIRGQLEILKSEKDHRQKHKYYIVHFFVNDAIGT